MSRLVAIVVLSLAVGPARAEEDAEEAPAASAEGQEARAKFAEGNRKYATGDYAGAEEAFKRAIALDPELPGPYRNLGLVYVATHRCDQAVARFEAYLKLRPESKHSARVQAEIDKCKGGGARPAGSAATELALVTVTAVCDGVQIEGAVVRVDGLTRGGTPLDLQMLPGRHQVRVERVGFEPAEVAVEIQANQTHDVVVELKRRAGAEPPELAASKPSRRPIAWALLGGAALALGVGAAFGILESANWQEATNLERSTHTRADLAAYGDRGSAYAAVAYTGYGLGVAAVAVAAVLFALDARRGEAHGEPALARRRLIVAPTGTGTAMGIVAAGSW
jgi:tetratricopeptide (TPR) repeat protein